MQNLKLTFITGNSHKFEEVKDLITKKFPQFSVENKNTSLLEIQADTLEEVAEFKVKSIRENIEPPYFIEDAGFFVDDFCNGFPGVYSSYVMKQIGYKGILKLMKGVEERKAHFESIIAYIDSDDQIHIFKGVNNGLVSLNARGTSGFGFDPIFISEDHPDKTFAELTMTEKNIISHRTRSMEKFLAFLEK